MDQTLHASFYQSIEPVTTDLPFVLTEQHIFLECGLFVEYNNSSGGTHKQGEEHNLGRVVRTQSATNTTILVNVFKKVKDSDLGVGAIRNRYSSKVVEL